MAFWAMAALGVACGGEEGPAEGPSAETGRLSRPEFLRQGNEICAQTKAELEEAAGLGAVTNPEAFATGTAIPLIENQLEELGQLAPPRPDERLVAEILKEAEAALAKLKQEPDAVAEAPGLFARAGSLARDYGLAECTI